MVKEAMGGNDDLPQIVAAYALEEEQKEKSYKIEFESKYTPSMLGNRVDFGQVVRCVEVRDYFMEHPTLMNNYVFCARKVPGGIVVDRWCARGEIVHRCGTIEVPVKLDWTTPVTDPFYFTDEFHSEMHVLIQ